MTYTQYVTRLMAMAQEIQGEIDFATVVPSAIESAEDRCYRDLNLLATVVRDSSSSATANSRTFTLPSASGRFVSIDGINVYTPVSSTTTRNPVMPVSRDFIDLAWPTETAASATTIPKTFAMITDQIIIFGPPPGAAFTVEIVGRIRPTAISSSNTTTFLSLYLPELFLAASLVEVANFNKTALPALPTLEGRYQTLLSSTSAEEARRRFATAPLRG